MNTRNTILTPENAPVVALHSSASSSKQWDQLIADMQGRFSVFAFDLPGYGKNPISPETGEAGASVSAIPVIREIEQIGEPVHLIGHSNGAGIALKIALLRPELIKSLTIYEPAVFHILDEGDAHSQSLRNEIQMVSGIVTVAAATEDPFAGLAQFLDFWNDDGFWDGLSSAAKQKFSLMINAIINDFARGFEETWQLRDLEKLDVPALVMMGLESPKVAQEVAVMIANALPNSRLALLPEMGHMAPIFQADWINPRIIEHITSVERPTTKFSWPIHQAA